MEAEQRRMAFGAMEAAGLTVAMGSGMPWRRGTERNPAYTDRRPVFARCTPARVAWARPEPCPGATRGTGNNRRGPAVIGISG